MSSWPGLLALGLFGPWGTGGQTPRSSSPRTLPSLEGGAPVVLPKLGKPLSVPVVVTFFASWCGPCETEMPAIARFARTEAADGVKIDFIGVDENDPSGGLAFTKRSGVGFPVGSDPYGVVLEDLEAEPALPQTIFINDQGDIVFHQVRVGHLRVGPSDLGQAPDVEFDFCLNFNFCLSFDFPLPSGVRAVRGPRRLRHHRP